MPRTRERASTIWYLRIKRKRATYFVAVNKMLTSPQPGGDQKVQVRDLRQVTARTMGIETSELQLCLPPKEGIVEQPIWFQDDQTLEELGLRNDSVICAILREENGQWEVPQIEPYPEPEVAESVDKKAASASSKKAA